MPTGQAIDGAWLAANAAAFGGDPTAGPWVLGKAFGSYSRPTQVGGLYPYYLTADVAADGTAFVAPGGRLRVRAGGRRLRIYY